MTTNTPFSISPNPVSLYLTPGIKSVLHKVRYTVDKRQGLTCILGDVGMGKSSVLRLLYSDYAAREDTIASLIPSPSYSSDFAFLKGICGDFGLPPKRSLYDQEQEMRAYLVERFKEKKNCVVFIDEAQKLNSKMLELVRAMLNFETNQHKLIQLVLAGQLELKERLLQEKSKALRSRIFAPSVLDPLSLGETRAMIAFRCDLGEIQNPFPDAVVEQIYTLTGGIPREILKVCAVAYELAQLKGQRQVSADTLEEAAGEAVLA
jgi:general secretion pathway protein A